MEEKAEPRAAVLARAVLLFLCVLTLFRLVYAARLGLAEDEAYYWQWSRHPDLAYYDQGPVIAWVIRAGTFLGRHTPLGVRLFIVLLAGLTGWLVFLTARAWLGERAAVWAVGLTSVAPLFAVGSVLATYDVPQVFLWTLTLYAFTRTVQKNRTRGWYVVGLLVGMGTLAKLPMLGFAPGVLLFLLFSPPNRRWLATPHPYFAFVLAVAICAPPLVVWNARHDGLGFLHLFAVGNRTGTTGEAAITGATRLRWWGDFWGGQAIALSPLLFFAEIAALLKRRDGRLDSGARHFLVAFTVPLLAVCLVIALRSRQEINWPVSAHVTGLMAVGALFARVWERGRRTGRAFVALAVLLALSMTTIAFFPQVLPALGLRVSADAAQKLNQTYGWPEVAARVQTVRRALEGEGRPVFVAGTTYRVNSVLAFYLPDQPQVQGLYPGTRRDQYFVWTDAKRLVSQNAVVCLEANDPAAADVLTARVGRLFVSVEEDGPPVVITRPGFAGPVRTWRLLICRSFRGYDPDAAAQGY